MMFVILNRMLDTPKRLNLNKGRVYIFIKEFHVVFKGSSYLCVTIKDICISAVTT